MILEKTGIESKTMDLGSLDHITAELGFVRWQWEYTRATYDLKLKDEKSGDCFYLRIATRAVQGRLEDPEATLEIEQVYMGRTTFPHGLEYEIKVPSQILDCAKKTLQKLNASFKSAV